MFCEDRKKMGELQLELELEVGTIADITLGSQTLSMYYHKTQNTSAQQTKREEVLNTFNKLKLMYVFHDVIE